MGHTTGNCRNCGRAYRFFVRKHGWKQSFCSVYCTNAYGQKKAARPSGEDRIKRVVALNQSELFRKRYGDSFYTTYQWLKIRHAALKLNNGRCELCGNSKSCGAVLHVDHIKPRSKYPELSLDPENLQVLCAECNIGKGDRDETDWRVGENGIQDTDEGNVR